jgi:hypothetical protein
LEGDKMMDREDIVIPITAIVTTLLIILIAVVVCLTTPKLVSEEIVEVDAIITDVRHRGPIATQYVKRAADNDIYFEYEGIKGNWDTDYSTYNKYKDKEGETIKCYLITRIYEDGSEEIRLVAVDDYEERN